MTVEWIQPIYDRTYIDVFSVEKNPSLENATGCYNASDLNRIENNTKYVMESMVEKKILRVPLSLAIKTDWVSTDIPTSDDMSRIINNIITLMDRSNPIISSDFKIIYTGTQINFVLANALEYNLELMKNQPLLPVKKWVLEIENGIIVEYETNKAEIAEDEVVHIQAVPYGEYAEYMTFTGWSGNSDDLQYLGDPSQELTTFTMVYHDSEYYSVSLTATFATRIPRKLTLHGGTIVETGATSGTYFAGDEILLLANLAPDEKRFYEWRGTAEALENITGGTEPSTSWLTMPDCDVELTSFYINAGQHRVYIDGKLDGYYNYNEYVFIYPESKGDKYTFAYWSGDTGYLESVTSNSFLMPDVDVRFYSNWTYNYSYNTVYMINGKIDGEIQGNNLREQSTHTIVADTPPEGKEFDYWGIEGVGTIKSTTSSTTTFTIGDGGAVLTAYYKDIPPSHTVTIENENNNGGTRSFTVREGDKYSISTTEVLADYMFQKWNKGVLIYSTNPSVTNITMGTSDVTYKAVYRDRKSYELVVNNGSGSGTYKERESISIKANAAPTGYSWDRWNYTNATFYSIGSVWSSTTTLVMGSADCEITAGYKADPTYHTVTVINGSGSGTYAQGTSVTCRGNQAPDGWEFSHWLENDTIVSYSNPYYFTMGTTDRTLTAVYKEIPYFTLTVINGSGSGTYIRNSQPRISMNPAPEGHQFLMWEVLEGDSNDVAAPLSENTYIRNLTHNVTVEATYHIPADEILYSLTIKGKDGTTITNNHPAGEEITIYSDPPNEGYEFHKWEGDTQFVYDEYEPTTLVTMPAHDISLEMLYQIEGYVTTYHVLIAGGEVRTSYDEETGEETWAMEGEFEERSVVPIRATDIDPAYKFNRWTSDDETGKSLTVVADLQDPTTTITIKNFKITLAADILPKEKYALTVNYGGTSGSYYEGQEVSIYFNLKDTDTTKYDFIRWSGNDLAYIKLVDGGAFDIYEPGNTSDNAQKIAMPGRNIIITAMFDTYHRLKLISGTIDDGESTEEFYKEGDEILIHADEIEGLTFSHWVGDVKYLNNRHLPNPTVTMPAGAVELTAKYVNSNNRNIIGCVDNYLYDIVTVTTSDVTMISGEMAVGCLVLDNKGHYYVVNNIEGDTLTIFRLSQKGGTTDG